MLWTSAFEATNSVNTDLRQWTVILSLFTLVFVVALKLGITNEPVSTLAHKPPAVISTLGIHHTIVTPVQTLVNIDTLTV